MRGEVLVGGVQRYSTSRVVVHGIRFQWGEKEKAR